MKSQVEVYYSWPKLKKKTAGMAKEIASLERKLKVLNEEYWDLKKQSTNTPHHD